MNKSVMPDTFSRLRYTAVTTSLLPSTADVGTIASVTDGAAGLAWGATLTGGGSTKYLVWYNGTGWSVVGK